VAVPAFDMHITRMKRQTGENEAFRPKTWNAALSVQPGNGISQRQI